MMSLEKPGVYSNDPSSAYFKSVIAPITALHARFTMWGKHLKIIKEEVPERAVIH
jgi:hypothetical protein